VSSSAQFLTDWAGLSSATGLVDSLPWLLFRHDRPRYRRVYLPAGIHV